MIVTMGMKLTIILIYQITFNGYHVLQTATKITKYRTIIQISKYAIATTNCKSSPPWVQCPMAIIKSQMVEKVEQDVYSELSLLA